MELSAKQNKYLALGAEAKSQYDGYAFRAFLRAAIWDESWRNVIDVLEDDFEADQFFKCGFYGDIPEYVTALRYGEIPASGRSTNWAEKTLEQGVSCLCICDGVKENRNTFYDGVYGLQGTEKIKVQGWFLGRTGSDGEPLLYGAERV